jgi:hypothetical protein
MDVDVLQYNNSLNICNGFFLSNQILNILASHNSGNLNLNNFNLSLMNLNNASNEGGDENKH